MLPSYVAVTCPSSVLSSATWPSLSSTSRPPLDHSHGHACHHKGEGGKAEAGAHIQMAWRVFCVMVARLRKCLGLGWQVSWRMFCVMVARSRCLDVMADLWCVEVGDELGPQRHPVLCTHNTTQQNTTQHHSTP
jgi:hypothetical protein